MKTKNILLRCECSSEVVSFDRFEDEEEIYIAVYCYSFIDISFFRRIKYAIDVLRGKKLRTADVVLSKENFDKIKEF